MVQRPLCADKAVNAGNRTMETALQASTVNIDIPLEIQGERMRVRYFHYSSAMAKLFGAICETLHLR